MKRRTAGTERYFRRILVTAALVLAAGLGCDEAEPPETGSELELFAMFLDESGAVEFVSHTDPELCPGGDCRRFFSFCYSSEEDIFNEWRDWLDDRLDPDSIRGRPGSWRLCAQLFRPIATVEYDAALCLPDLPDSTFPRCDPGDLCLAVDGRDIAFPNQPVAADSLPGNLGVYNSCPDRELPIAFDGRVLCDDATLCTQCDPADLRCEEDFTVVSDCLPDPGEDVRRLAPLDEPGFGCNVGVVFTPQERGERRGRIVVPADTGEFFEIAVSGTGEGGTVSILPTPGETFCRDSTDLAGNCTAGVALMTYSIRNVAAEAGVVVREAAVDPIEPDTGTGYQLVRTELTGTPPTPINLPFILLPGETFQARVRYCLSVSPTGGADNERARLRIITDDPAAISVEQEITWASAGCP